MAFLLLIKSQKLILCQHWKKGIDEARKEIEAIAEADHAPTFENTIEALEKAGELLDKVSSVLFNLNAAETNDEIQRIAREVSPKLSAFDNEVKQNEKLWNRIKQVNNNKASYGLSEEQLMLLDKTVKGFVRNGADLKGEDKERFKEISIELSTLSLQFGENLLAENQ